MTKLTVMDVKQALWNKDFREMFPEYKDGIERYLKDPGCACNLNFVLSLMNHKDRMKKYFPNKEIVTPAEEPPPPNDWGVINCPIHQLEDRMRKVPPGKRMVAAARWKDRVTIILNDLNAIVHVPTVQKDLEEQIKQARESKIDYKVINTNIQELLHELRKLSHTPKSMVLTRWQDQITLIVHERGLLF